MNIKDGHICTIFTFTYRVGLAKAQHKRESKTTNKKQDGLAHSRFIVCVTPKQKKNIA